MEAIGQGFSASVLPWSLHPHVFQSPGQFAHFLNNCGPNKMLCPLHSIFSRRDEQASGQIAMALDRIA